MNIHDKLDHFEDLKKSLKETEKTCSEKKELIIKEFEAKVEGLKVEYNAKVNEAMQPFENDQAKFKMEFKTAFGITFGEPADPIAIVRTISKVFDIKTGLNFD